jgi:flagellar hook-associated protein 3 FlgL
MNIRITAQVQVATTIANLRRQSGGQAKFQDQIASGVSVKFASDDPLAFASLARVKAAANSFTTSLQVAGEASSDIDAGVDALVNGNQILVRAKQLAISAGSPDSDAAVDEALAGELDGLIERFVGEANTQVDGRYLFGGDKSTTPPFRVSGTNGQGKPTAVIYDGSATPARSDIGDDYTVETASVGSSIFQKSGANSFKALIGLRDTLRDRSLSSDQRIAALSRYQTDLDSSRAAIDGAVGAKSADSAGLESLQFRLQDLKLASNIRTDQLETTDFANAIVQLKQQEAAYQATLNVAANLVPPSLFDFIR